MLVSEQLRKFLGDSQQTKTTIAREARVAYGVLKGFLDGKSGLNLATVDKLADYLSLSLVEKNTLQSIKTAKALALSEQLHCYLTDCDATTYRIAEDAGVEYAVLLRFNRGQQGLQLKTVDKLAQYLGLTLLKKS